MLNFRLLLTLLMLVGIIYGIVNVQSFLEDNFVNNDTKIKTQLNDFLNGKQKVPGATTAPAPTPEQESPTERIIEIDQRQLDETIQNSENE